MCKASPRLDTSFHTEEFRENKRSKISHPTVNIDSPVTLANSVPPPENTQRAVAFSEDKILYSNTVQRYSERKARPKQKEGKTGESGLLFSDVSFFCVMYLIYIFLA